MKYRFTLLLLTLFGLNSCVNTARVTQKFTAGSSLSPNEVILFTGYNGEDSKTSDRMLSETRRILSKCGIRVINLYDPNLNHEFLKAGFPGSEADVEDDAFIHKMKEVFGVTHLFSVGSVDYYAGNSMDVRREDLIYGGSGIVFEVYDLATESSVASMKIKGKTWQMYRDSFVESYPEGSIYTNYRKGLRTLMKTSTCK